MSRGRFVVVVVVVEFEHLDIQLLLYCAQIIAIFWIRRETKEVATEKIQSQHSNKCNKLIVNRNLKIILSSFPSSLWVLLFGNTHNNSKKYTLTFESFLKARVGPTRSSRFCTLPTPSTKAKKCTYRVSIWSTACRDTVACSTGMVLWCAYRMDAKAATTTLRSATWSCTELSTKMSTHTDHNTASMWIFNPI